MFGFSRLDCPASAKNEKEIRKKLTTHTMVLSKKSKADDARIFFPDTMQTVCVPSAFVRRLRDPIFRALRLKSTYIFVRVPDGCTSTQFRYLQKLFFDDQALVSFKFPTITRPMSLCRTDSKGAELNRLDDFPDHLRFDRTGCR